MFPRQEGLNIKHKDQLRFPEKDLVVGLTQLNHY